MHPLAVLLFSFTLLYNLFIQFLLDEEPTQNEDVHKPAVSITQEKQADKLRQKMERMKERRKLKEKLG